MGLFFKRSKIIKAFYYAVFLFTFYGGT